MKICFNLKSITITCILALLIKYSSTSRWTKFLRVYDNVYYGAFASIIFIILLCLLIVIQFEFLERLKSIDINHGIGLIVAFGVTKGANYIYAGCFDNADELLFIGIGIFLCDLIRSHR